MTRDQYCERSFEAYLSCLTSQCQRLTWLISRGHSCCASSKLDALRCRSYHKTWAVSTCKTSSFFLQRRERRTSDGAASTMPIRPYTRHIIEMPIPITPAHFACSRPSSCDSKHRGKSQHQWDKKRDTTKAFCWHPVRSALSLRTSGTSHGEEPNYGCFQHTYISVSVRLQGHKTLCTFPRRGGRTARPCARSCTCSLRLQGAEQRVAARLCCE